MRTIIVGGHHFEPNKRFIVKKRHDADAIKRFHLSNGFVESRNVCSSGEIWRIKCQNVTVTYYRTGTLFYNFFPVHFGKMIASLITKNPTLDSYSENRTSDSHERPPSIEGIPVMESFLNVSEECVSEGTGKSANGQSGFGYGRKGELVLADKDKIGVRWMIERTRTLQQEIAIPRSSV